MTNTSNFLFKGLHILAWIIFVGLCIEAGAIIVNFAFCLFKPEMVQNLYQKLDLSELFQSSRLAFYIIYSFVISLSILKAILFYIVIRLMHKMDLLKPFSNYVSDQILLLSYYTIAIGLLSYIARQFVTNLVQNSQEAFSLTQFWNDSQAFILMGAIIYIIAVIFRRGVVIQNENDLTI
jgi:hypothetical protein